MEKCGHSTDLVTREWRSWELMKKTEEWWPGRQGSGAEMDKVSFAETRSTGRNRLAGRSKEALVWTHNSLMCSRLLAGGQRHGPEAGKMPFWQSSLANGDGSHEACLMRDCDKQYGKC